MEEIVMVSRQFQHPTLLGLLEEKYRVHRLWEASEPEEFIKNHCQGARAMVTDFSKAPKEFISLLPKLGCISNFGVGYDNVPIEHATDLGIQVTNTPDVLTNDVADLAIGLLLSVARSIPEGDRLCVRAPGRKEACGSPKVSPGKKSGFWEWDGSGRPLPNVPRLSAPCKLSWSTRKTRTGLSLLFEVGGTGQEFRLPGCELPWRRGDPQNREPEGNGIPWFRRDIGQYCKGKCD